MLDVDLTSSVDVVHIYIGNGIGTLTKVGAYDLVSISSVNRRREWPTSRLSRRDDWLSVDLTSRVDGVLIAKQVDKVGVKVKAMTDRSILDKVELGLGLGGTSFVSGGDGPGLGVEFSVCGMNVSEDAELTKEK